MGTGPELRLKEKKNKGINYSTSGQASPVTLACRVACKKFSLQNIQVLKGGRKKKTKDQKQKQKGGVILKFKRTLKVYIL